MLEQAKGVKRHYQKKNEEQGHSVNKQIVYFQKSKDISAKTLWSWYRHLSIMWDPAESTNLKCFSYKIFKKFFEILCW